MSEGVSRPRPGRFNIAVASGKGGTGKTTVAVGLALALQDAMVVDCDVEAPNAHLFLNPTIEQREQVGIPVPVVDDERCTTCRLCAEVCEFHAIGVMAKRVLVFEELCHGCGACSYLCPENAIREVPRPVGEVLAGHSGSVKFVEGRLNPGEPMPVPVVREALKQAKFDGTVIIDCAPGTGCPVVQAMTTADVCLLVTEPTPLGLHDLKLAVSLCKVLGLPAGVILNRSDIGDDAVERYCRQQGLEILMRIPFDIELARAYSVGIPITRIRPEYADKLRLVALGLQHFAGTRPALESRV